MKELTMALLVFCIGSIITVFWLIVLLNAERKKRKQFETMVAKYRDGQTLNEDEVILRQSAKEYDWMGETIGA